MKTIDISPINHSYLRTIDHSEILELLVHPNKQRSRRGAPRAPRADRSLQWLRSSCPTRLMQILGGIGKAMSFREVRTSEVVNSCFLSHGYDGE